MISFAYPWALTALILVPLLYLYERFVKKPPAIVVPSVRPFAAGTSKQPSRRFAGRPVSFGFRCYLAAFALLVVALARPRIGDEKVVIRAKGIDIILALDMSGSMQAFDVPANYTDGSELYKAIDSGDILNNVRIRKGDYVFIAQRMEASVIVCGEVKNPHKRLYEPGMGLVETLTAAGWVTETHWSHVIIIRGGLANPHYYKVNIDGIMAGKCHNVKLKAGDIVYVPKDNLSEYNVFVRKLLPTAQLVGLIAQPFSTLNKLD